MKLDSKNEPVADRLRRILDAHFSPTALEIHDESARHAGHAGARPGGDSHFRIRIVSAGFAGMNRVARHRAVYAALEAEMKNTIHALALEALTPDDVQARISKSD
ncbi:MAG: BolA family transcriptional regulator [Alphaproteobacteria bacterium]|nr:BolA family transcriptional regulator [Alphaproteobacteria bacterium]